MIWLARILFCLVLTGCAALPQILATIGQGAQWIGSALDVADAGKAAFFARHPSQERQAHADQVLARARQAVAVLDGAVAAVQAGEEQDLDAARRNALAAYEELYQLLEDLGVLDGICRDCGGAETEAPAPRPVPLPPPQVVAHRLGA